MKYQSLLFCLLAALFLATGCDEDDSITDPEPDPLQIRLLNATDEELTSASLRFNWEGVTDEYVEYGNLNPDELTEYRGFEAGGSCDSDLRVCSDSAPDCSVSIPVCLCICAFEAGDYTGTVTKDTLQNDQVIYCISIEQD